MLLNDKIKPMKKTNIKIRFVIFNDLDINLDAISNAVGCKPTLSYHKQDKIRDNLYRKNNAWEYSTDYIETLYIDEILDTFTTILKPNISKLKGCILKYKLQTKFYLVINIINGQSPALVFSEDFIHLCSDLNATIDTDLYVYNS
jgi:hypothetical protein